MVFETSHNNYRIVNNDDEPLPGININDYTSRTEKVYYDRKYNGYKGVVWTPLDIPKIDFDQNKLWEIWEAVQNGGKYNNWELTAHPWFDEYPDLLNGWKNHDYRAFNIFKNNHYYDRDNTGIPHQLVIDHFPDVVKWIESLPFDNIHWCAFVGRPDDGVGPHYDEAQNYEQLTFVEPSQVRARFAPVTDWRKEHFYMTNTHGQERLYPMLPPDTDSFCYDGTKYEHGADRGFHPKDRIQLMPMGKLNQEKWHALLERSINKYKDYVITVEHFK